MKTLTSTGVAGRRRRWALGCALILMACQEHNARRDSDTAAPEVRSANAAEAGADAIDATLPDAATATARRRLVTTADPAWAAASEPASDGDAGQTAGEPKRMPTAPRLKLALFGDQGMGSDARDVLTLIADEHADAVIHLGDFSYDEATPTAWVEQIDSVLGPQFPYFAVIGNHDVTKWTGSTGFAARLTERLRRVPEAQCRGEYGVDAVCNFRGLVFVLSGVGTYGRDHERFLDTALTNSNALFKLCIWHKNQHDMQVGSKTDEVGWEAYRICARNAAPVITGHEHSYARTLLLAEIGSRDHAHGPVGRPEDLVLEPGRTFVVVSGLGGESRRSRTADHSADSWWASIYAQGYQFHNGELQGTAPEIEYGSLFIEFYVDDDPNKARAYFKTVDGRVHDEFTFSAASAP